MATELSDRIPVVDGDQGADIYGLATNAARAVEVAREMFADEISHAERMGPVTLRTGDQISEAWVVITVPCAETMESA
jgi:hypothetical protein